MTFPTVPPDHQYRSYGEVKSGTDKAHRVAETQQTAQLDPIEQLTAQDGAQSWPEIEVEVVWDDMVADCALVWWLEDDGWG